MASNGSENTKVVLYGVDMSQPCRTVSWLLRAHNVPFEYVHVMPGAKKNGTRSPDFLKKNKNATVPVIEHNGNVIADSAAICVYLAETFKWDDVYPSGPANAAVRAAINSWLHWHHRNTREFTIGLFAPLLRPDLKFTPEKLKELDLVVKKAAKILDEQLGSTPFLVGNSPTLADYAIYTDVGQCSSTMLGLFDFAPYKNLSAWLERMQKLPYHAETHESIDALKGMVEQAKAAKAKL